MFMFTHAPLCLNDEVLLSFLISLFKDLDVVKLLLDLSINVLVKSL